MRRVDGKGWLARGGFVLTLALAFVSPACSEDRPLAHEPASTVFLPDADLTLENAFFDFPYPSDLRLTSLGTPDLARFPDPGVPILAGLKSGATERKGFPVVPVGYFRLTKRPRARDPETIVSDRGVLLIDIDPSSPARGTLFPVVAQTPNADPYVPENLIAIGARPGIVLSPRRKYAFVVTRSVGFEEESTGGIVAPPTLAEMARGETPRGAKGAVLQELYRPLWESLERAGVRRDDVIGATVFTTGDVVADTNALGSTVLARHAPDLEDLVLEGEDKAPFCHLRARVRLPQFQRGRPPFHDEGLFEIGPDGAPVMQREESIGVSIAIPREPMPEAGYPLVVYFHGSGGVSRELIDGGDKASGGDVTRWPAAVLTKHHHFAVAGAALPMSPERVASAGAFDYVNINNMIATRDTFRQGVIESRLFLSALERVRIPASALAGCAGPSLPKGATEYRFLPSPHAQGQSMGAMYTNLVAATDERVQLAVPTGAGGYWSYFILRTTKIPGAAGLLSLVLKTTERLSFLHPAVHVAETALEPIDPIVSVPRIGQDPLPNHPSRPIYVPAGKADSYFPEAVFDAMAVAYRHPRVGDAVWSTMDQALALVGVKTPTEYPVKSNVMTTSLSGSKPFTSVVVQYANPTGDGHAIYRSVDAVMHQYGCFHESFAKTKTAVVSAPGAVGSPCDL